MHSNIWSVVNMPSYIETFIVAEIEVPGENHPPVANL